VRSGDGDGEKRNSFSLESIGETQVRGISARLKKLYCEHFIFGERNVFGRKEDGDGDFLEKGKGFYAWPPRKVHNLSRDPHPELEERFPVPDHKVCWGANPEKEFEEYRPEFATEADKNEALKSILAKRKPVDGQSLLKFAANKLQSNAILECHELSVELQNAKIAPDKARNPCGR
jgi:hypothetical protein